MNHMPLAVTNGETLGTWRSPWSTFTKLAG